MPRRAKQRWRQARGVPELKWVGSEGIESAWSADSDNAHSDMSLCTPSESFARDLLGSLSRESDASAPAQETAGDSSGVQRTERGYAPQGGTSPARHVATSPRLVGFVHGVPLTRTTHGQARSPSHGGEEASGSRSGSFPLVHRPEAGSWGRWVER